MIIVFVIFGYKVCSLALIDAVLSEAPRTRYKLAPLADVLTFIGSLPSWLQDYNFQSTTSPPYTRDRVLKVREHGSTLSNFDPKPFLT